MNTRYDARTNERVARLLDLPGGVAGLAVPDEGRWAVGRGSAPPLRPSGRFPDPVSRSHFPLTGEDLDPVSFPRRKTNLPVTRGEVRNVGPPAGVWELVPVSARIIGR